MKRIVSGIFAAICLGCIGATGSVAAPVHDTTIANAAMSPRSSSRLMSIAAAYTEIRATAVVGASAHVARTGVSTFAGAGKSPTLTILQSN
jgi:hypothetical protein